MAKKLFEKGNKAAAKRGPNKMTTTVKAAVLDTFNRLQQDEEHNLDSFAKKFPKEFHVLASKLIPTEVTAQVEATHKVITGMVIK